MTQSEDMHQRAADESLAVTAITELGRSYVDLITGFHGVATAKAVYIDHRTQTQLTPSAGFTPGKQPRPSVPPEWFDDGRLARLPTGKITL